MKLLKSGKNASGGHANNNSYSTAVETNGGVHVHHNKPPRF